MKKYAAALLSVFLVCGCSNITPNNEKVEASQEKLENMTALYTGFAEANETIDNKSKIGVWAYYEDGTKEFITQGWTVKEPVTLEAGKTSEVTVKYRGLESTILVECSEVDEASFKVESQSPDQSDLEVTHSKWYGKKLTYTGKIIARVDDKDFRGYMINIFDDKSYVCVLDVNKEFDFKKIRLLRSGHMDLGVWKQKDGLEKKWVLLDLRQNTWKKYKCVFEELKMVRRPNLWI